MENICILSQTHTSQEQNKQDIVEVLSLPTMEYFRVVFKSVRNKAYLHSFLHVHGAGFISLATQLQKNFTPLHFNQQLQLSDTWHQS